MHAAFVHACMLRHDRVRLLDDGFQCLRMRSCAEACMQGVREAHVRASLPLLPLLARVAASFRLLAAPEQVLHSHLVPFTPPLCRCFIWAGKDAPRQDRASSFPFAQAYLKRWKRPSVLPITRFNDGMESEAFKAHFGPPEKLGCCTVS